jgi:hypothetical protein
MTAPACWSKSLSALRNMTLASPKTGKPCHFEMAGQQFGKVTALACRTHSKWESARSLIVLLKLQTIEGCRSGASPQRPFEDVRLLETRLSISRKRRSDTLQEFKEPGVKEVGSLHAIPGTWRI